MSDLNNRRTDKRIRNPVKHPVQRVKHVRKAGFAHQPPILIEIRRQHQCRVRQGIIITVLLRPHRSSGRVAWIIIRDGGCSDQYIYADGRQEGEEED